MLGKELLSGEKKGSWYGVPPIDKAFADPGCGVAVLWFARDYFHADVDTAIKFVELKACNDTTLLAVFHTEIVQAQYNYGGGTSDLCAQFTTVVIPDSGSFIDKYVTGRFLAVDRTPISDWTKGTKFISTDVYGPC